MTTASCRAGSYDSRRRASSTPVHRQHGTKPLPRVAGHLRWSHQPLPDPRALRVLATNGSLFFFLPRNREEGRGGEGSGGRRGDSSPPPRRHAAAEPPQPYHGRTPPPGVGGSTALVLLVIGVGQAHMHRGTSVMVGCVPVRAAGKRRKLRFATLYKEGAFCCAACSCSKPPRSRLAPPVCKNKQKGSGAGYGFSV